MKKIYMTPATEVQATASYAIMEGSPTQRDVVTGGPGYSGETEDPDEEGRVKGRNDYYSLW